MAEGDEIVSLVAGTGDRERLFDGHEHTFWAAWELGDPDRRSAELASMTRVAEELRQPPTLDGRLGAGPRPVAGFPDANLLSEHTDEAEALLHDLASRDLSDWHVDEEWLTSICLLAETCAILGDTERAAPLYGLLLPYGSLNAVAVPDLTLDSTSRPLGILATMLGRFDAAGRHFDEALRMNQRMGARPSVAHTQEDHARMLLRRNARGDRERAEKLLSQAQATYDELGMQGAAASAAALL